MKRKRKGEERIVIYFIVTNLALKLFTDICAR